jgi:hypothetical protein
MLHYECLETELNISTVDIQLPPLPELDKLGLPTKITRTAAKLCIVSESKVT